jgi:hypothetical protein
MPPSSFTSPRGDPCCMRATSNAQSAQPFQDNRPFRKQEGPYPSRISCVRWRLAAAHPEVEGLDDPHLVASVTQGKASLSSERWSSRATTRLRARIKSLSFDALIRSGRSMQSAQAKQRNPGFAASKQMQWCVSNLGSIIQLGVHSPEIQRTYFQRTYLTSRVNCDPQERPKNVGPVPG